MKKISSYLKVGFIAVVLWQSVAFILSELLTTIGYKPIPPTLVENDDNTPILFGEKITYRYPTRRFSELDSEEELIEYVVFVLANASHPERRKLIRQTWGQNNRHVFFGVAGSFDNELQNEFDEHQDIVWIEKEDKYQNRAYITMAMIYVLKTHLQNFQYIWKIDDDVYVNTKKLSSWLHHPTPTSGLIGTCTKDSVVVRDPASMWYVPESVFKEPYFPPYSVQTYAVSRSLGDCVHKKVQSAKIMGPEDALMGILANRCQQTCSDVGSTLYEEKLGRYDENTTTMVRLGNKAKDPEKLRMYFIEMHQKSCGLGHSLESSCANLLRLSVPPTAPQTVSTMASTTVPPTTPPTAIPTQPNNTTNECNRPCKSYTNRLFLRPLGWAGLNDRIFMLKQLITIAGYLCATVDYPRPFYMLSVKHNNWVNISLEMEWSDLIAFNTSLYKSVTMFSTIPEPLEPFSRHFKDSVYSNWTHIIMKKYSETSFSVVEDFIKANETVTTQQEKMMNGEKNVLGFIWMLHGSVFEWNKQLSAFLSEQRKQLLEVGDVSQAKMLPIRHDRSSECYQNSIEDSERVKQIADMIWDDSIALAGGSKNETVVGSLNLRRGDATDQCDTELPTMQEYLSCAFNGTESKVSKIALLFSSDETNTTYRDAVVALANSFSNVQSMDLDKMIQEMLDRMVQEGSLPSWLRDNNFFIFGIAQHIHYRAHFRLVRRRRKHCYPCKGHFVLEKLSKYFSEHPTDVGE